MSRYPADLTQLIGLLRKLPGVGNKTSERYAFHLLGWPEKELQQLAQLLGRIKTTLRTCPECHCLMQGTHCGFCEGGQRDPSQLCVLAYARDVYLIEETRAYRGHYHVVGSLLSPLDQKTLPPTAVEELRERIRRLGVTELILAFDSTLEGDATTLFLKETLADLGLTITRLAFGIPMGSSLDHLDGETLSRALSGRLGC